jgi:GNAT superfamily N-acetyltransferase
MASQKPPLIKIRLVASPDDLSDIVRAELERLDMICFPEDKPYPKEGCFWWLAFDGKRVIAFAGLKPLAGINRGTGFLCRAGVIPNARGSKVQRRLVRARIKKALQLGLKRVITYTSRVNFGSIINLLKSGMRFYSPSNDWAHKEALYFCRVLSEPV